MTAASSFWRRKTCNQLLHICGVKPTVGFDHGAGHPLLFLDDAKAPNCQKNNGFSDLGNYSEWPKVASEVIQARLQRLHGVPGVINGKFSVREMATKSPLVARYDYI